MVENGMEAPPNGDTRRRGRGRGDRVGVGERERVAGQETSSADEVIGLKIKRWRHLKPIPVNELSGARGGKEETGEGRAGGGGAGRGRASPAPQRSSPRGGRSGGSGRRARVTFPTDRATDGPLRGRARRRALVARPRSRLLAARARARFSSLRVRGPRARVRSPPARSRGGRSLNPPTLVQRNHGDPSLGPSLGKKVLESKVQGSSFEREVAGTLRKIARTRAGRRSPTPSSLKGKALHDCLFFFFLR